MCSNLPRYVSIYFPSDLYRLQNSPSVKCCV
nr:MAG TPA: hypothetical protein [Bacteriophage sp.]